MARGPLRRLDFVIDSVCATTRGLSGITAFDQIVLLVLIRYLDRQPSQALIARITGMSTRNVGRCIKTLKGHGIIREESTGGGLAKSYALNMVEGDDVPQLKMTDTLNNRRALHARHARTANATSVH